MADQSSLPAIVRPVVPSVTFDEMAQMAEAFAKSGLFGVKTKEAALSLLMIAQAEGTHPALAVMEYDIIEGKPARKAERLLARFQMSGGKVNWLKYSALEVWGEFSHPMGSAVTIKWAIKSDDPEVTSASKITFYKRDGNAGKWVPLTDKYNWKSWPRAMLRSRVISEGVRTCFPGASLITLTSEEALDADVLSVETIPEDDGSQIVYEKTIETPTEFTKGAAAEDLVDKLIGAMNNARSEGELTALLAEAMALKGKVSNNRIYALEETHAQNETRIADESLDRAGARETEAIREPAPAAGWSEFERTKTDLPNVEDKTKLAEIGALIKASTRKMTDAQRAELRGLYKEAQDRLNG